LPSGRKSGLVHAIDVLKDVEEIGFVHLTERDVVRHELVKKINTSYDRYEKTHKDVKYGEKKENNSSKE
jgi:phosphate starvation-inducible PhoH-like protein